PEVVVCLHHPAVHPASAISHILLHSLRLHQEEPALRMILNAILPCSIRPHPFCYLSILRIASKVAVHCPTLRTCAAQLSLRHPILTLAPQTQPCPAIQILIFNISSCLRLTGDAILLGTFNLK